jgi:drug/metabolite transporter (DMT)-like permease
MVQQNKATLSSLCALVVLGAIWGGSFVFIKLGLESFDPATIVAMRLGGGALVLYLALRYQGHQLPTTLRIWRDLALVGVLGMVLPFFLITWGEQHISSGLAAILVATTPLFTLLLALLLTQDERLGMVPALGVLLGFAGVAVAVDVLELDSASAGARGQLAVLGAALCYSFAALFGRRAFRGMPALVPATGTMIGGSVVIVPLALLLDGPPTLAPTGMALLGVLALTLLSTAFAYILYYWVLARIGSSRTTMVTYLVPIFALLLGWLLLNEQIGLHTLLGLLLVLSGVMLANGTLRWPRRSATPA